MTREPPAPMWVKIDDALPGHPKFQRLSSAARCLWLEGLCYCGRNLTDGRIPKEAGAGLAFSVAMRDGLSWERLISELVDAGLWEDTSDGWTVHDFLDYNPSRVEVSDARAKTRERVAAWRARRAPTVTDGVSNSVTNAVRTPAPSSSPSPSSFPSGAAAADARDAERRLHRDVVWAAFEARLGARRSPREKERSLLARWYEAGIAADFIAYVIEQPRHVPDTLLWFDARVLEDWAGRSLEERRLYLLDRLATRPAGLTSDVAAELCEQAEAAEGVEELEAAERALALALEGAEESR